jgi:mono/diheme cytochrome c family protein
MGAGRCTTKLNQGTMKKLICIGLAATALTGCFYDKEALVYPQDPNNASCDTTIVTYTAVIQPLIQTRCANCHTGSVTSGINLSTYNFLKAKSQDNNKILTRLTTSNPSQLMPQGGPKLPDCEINKIRAWINRGYPN